MSNQSKKKKSKDKAKSKLKKHNLDIEENNTNDKSDNISNTEYLENEEEPVDRFATTLQKILQQAIDNKNPLLSKRKTPSMKAIEEENIENDKVKKKKRELKIERENQASVTDFNTAIKERQLKKLATRGVIALFNAIAKAKRETNSNQ